MNKIKILFLISTVLIVTSCVPTKDLIYLQNKDNSEAKSTINPVVFKPYRLQANDIVSITIKALDPKLVDMFATENLVSQQGKSDIQLYYSGYTVDDHGNIRIPILGEINVLGFTLDEVRLKVEKELLDKYFNKEANVFVSVKLSGFRYTTNGEVGSPGVKTLYQDKVTILEAIANSGDITITGDRKSVVIIRQMAQGAEIHTIDLTNINAMQSPYYYIQPNDYIYVKPLKQKTWGTGKTGIESIGTLVTILSLITTTFLLLKK